MIKPYFIKFFPSDEIIQPEDKVMKGETPFGTSALIYTVTGVLNNTLLTFKEVPITDLAENYKVARPWLCTRHLKEGDTLSDCLSDGEARVIKHFETVLPFGVWVFEDDKFIHADHAWKKVAELSAGSAKWIKELQEFEEKDVRIWAHDGVDINYFDVQEYDPEQYHLNAVFAQINCPNCDNFH